MQFFRQFYKGGDFRPTRNQAIKKQKRGSESMENKRLNKYINTGNIANVSIPDTEKTIKTLDHIYEVVERMNPKLKDLTEFTEILTAFKHSVGASAFLYGLQMGLNISEEDETPDLKA